MRALAAVGAWARCEGIPAGGGVPPSQGRREEPSVEAVALLASRCLAAAGLSAGHEVGLVLAVGSALEGINRSHARAVLGGGPVSPHGFLYTTGNAVAARVSRLLGLRGECLTVPDPAAPFRVASSLLARGAAAAVLVGGTSARSDPAGSVEGGTALLCLESPERVRIRGGRVWGLVWPEAPGPGEPLAPGGEEAGAASVIGALAEGRSAVFDCGTGGRLVVESTAAGSER